jgi:U6 snRNA-associated Sm-like protein LSm7
MDLTGLLGKQVTVHFLGGREVIGILNGYDQITNMILNEVVEIFRDPEDSSKELSRRKLGVVIIRGPSITTIFPSESLKPIENPFEN